MFFLVSVVVLSWSVCEVVLVPYVDAVVTMLMWKMEEVLVVVSTRHVDQVWCLAQLTC